MGQTISIWQPHLVVTYVRMDTAHKAIAYAFRGGKVLCAVKVSEYEHQVTRV